MCSHARLAVPRTLGRSVSRHPVRRPLVADDPRSGGPFATAAAVGPGLRDGPGRQVPPRSVAAALGPLALSVHAGLPALARGLPEHPQRVSRLRSARHAHRRRRRLAAERAPDGDRARRVRDRLPGGEGPRRSVLRRARVQRRPRSLEPPAAAAHATGLRAPAALPGSRGLRGRGHRAGPRARLRPQPRGSRRLDLPARGQRYSRGGGPERGPRQAQRVRGGRARAVLRGRTGARAAREPGARPRGRRLPDDRRRARASDAGSRGGVLRGSPLRRSGAPVDLRPESGAEPARCDHAPVEAGRRGRRRDALRPGLRPSRGAPAAGGRSSSDDPALDSRAGSRSLAQARTIVFAASTWRTPPGAPRLTPRPRGRTASSFSAAYRLSVAFCVGFGPLAA